MTFAESIHKLKFNQRSVADVRNTKWKSFKYYYSNVRALNWFDIIIKIFKLVFSDNMYSPEAG